MKQTIKTSVAINLSDFKKFLTSVIKFSDKFVGTEIQKEHIIDNIVEQYMNGDYEVSYLDREDFDKNTTNQEHFVILDNLFDEYGIVSYGPTGVNYFAQLVIAHNIKGDNFVIIR